MGKLTTSWVAKSGQTLYHAIPMQVSGTHINTSGRYGAEILPAEREKLGMTPDEHPPLVFAATRFCKSLAFMLPKPIDDGKILNYSVDAANTEIALVWDIKMLMSQPVDATMFSFPGDSFVQLTNMQHQSVSTKPVPFSKTTVALKADSLDDLMRAGLQIFSFSENLKAPDKDAAAAFTHLKNDPEKMAALGGLVESGKVIWENNDRGINPNVKLAEMMGIEKLRQGLQPIQTSRSLMPALNLNEVDKDAGFSHHATGLTKEDKTTLANIQVGTTGEYNNFGDIESIREDATEFFVRLGNSPDNARKQADITCRLIEKAIAGFGSETAWITIRAFTRTDEYKVPRWHTDSKFFVTDADQLKAVFNLKGSSTRLKRASAQQREEVRALQRADMDEMESRRRRTELLASSKTETTPAGCFTVMIAGDNDYATVHSEPDIRGPRIFLSVLPGIREQIEELRLGMVDKKAGIKFEERNLAQTQPRPKELKR